MSGYTGAIRDAWSVTNQANAFCNLMATASVCMCGSDGIFNSMGEAIACNFDGTIIVAGGGVADEIVTGGLPAPTRRYAPGAVTATEAA